MKTIILDTETSGLTGKDRIIEFGIVILNEQFEIEYKGVDYCSIPFELSKEASDYTGIKNSDLVNAKKIKDTPSFSVFQKYNNSENIVVIHNSWFDLYMLYLSHIKVECKIVDTLNCARHLYPDSEKHSLVYLMNEIVYKTNDKKTPFVQKHNAMDDCIVLLDLLKYMLQTNTMLDLLCMTDRWVIGFGKHKGKLWKDCDKRYLKWVHDKYASENSPTQLYVKTLLKLPLCPQQQKMAEYLHIDC